LLLPYFVTFCFPDISSVLGKQGTFKNKKGEKKSIFLSI